MSIVIHVCVCWDDHSGHRVKEEFQMRTGVKPAPRVVLMACGWKDTIGGISEGGADAVDQKIPVILVRGSHCGRLSLGFHPLVSSVAL